MLKTGKNRKIINSDAASVNNDKSLKARAGLKKKLSSTSQVLFQSASSINSVKIF